MFLVTASYVPDGKPVDLRDFFPPSVPDQVLQWGVVVNYPQVADTIAQCLDNATREVKIDTTIVNLNDNWDEEELYL